MEFEFEFEFELFIPAWNATPTQPKRCPSMAEGTATTMSLDQRLGSGGIVVAAVHRPLTLAQVGDLQALRARGGVFRLGRGIWPRRVVCGAQWRCRVRVTQRPHARRAIRSRRSARDTRVCSARMRRASGA